MYSKRNEEAKGLVSRAFKAELLAGKGLAERVAELKAAGQ